MPNEFELVYSKAILAKLKELRAIAVERGQSREFDLAALYIDGVLRKSPLEFGEPLYTLREAKLKVFSGARSPLIAHWAVHEHLPIVFMKGYGLLPHTPPTEVGT